MLSEQEFENPQELEDLYFSEFEQLKKEQGITNNKEYHYDTPCTVFNQKKMLLEAGFRSVKKVWHKGQTVILVAEK
jgi:tRNA (cmo5U34)-methyltransferase